MLTKLILRKTLLAAPIVALLLALQTFSSAFGSTNSPNTEADKIHVVLLVAGADSEIGNADMQDIAAMKRIIDTTFAAESHRVVYHDLTGKNPATNRYYTGSEVLTYLRGMNVGPNDNLLIYHSGHGAILDRNNPEDSQILVIDGGELTRKSLLAVARYLQPRAAIILTDCCSNYVGSPVSLDESELNTATVRNLLLKAQGVISITAADDGASAVASFVGANPAQAGSAFTVAMTRLWYRMDVTYTSWMEFFPDLRTETGAASNGRHAARAFQLGAVSTPMYGNLLPPARD